MNLFDVVIPVGPNEYPIIEEVVLHIKKNVKSFNNIFLVIENTEITVDGCITIDEKTFPFTKETIKKVIGDSCRISWIYQQLLKLYAVNAIPNCLENILVVDADVFILNELDFLIENKFIFTVGYEHTIEYHQHSSKLHPSLTRIHQKFSGISHHMIFNRDHINELFNLVENFHQKDFLEIFLISIDARDKSNLRCSEYEIYFNFMCLYHPDKIILRELRWANLGYLTNTEGRYDFVSIPKYLGTR